VQTVCLVQTLCRVKPCVKPAARAQVFSNMVWILFIFEFFTGAWPCRQA